MLPPETDGWQYNILTYDKTTTGLSSHSRHIDCLSVETVPGCAVPSLDQQTTDLINDQWLLSPQTDQLGPGKIITLQSLRGRNIYCHVLTDLTSLHHAANIFLVAKADQEIAGNDK